MLIPYLGEKSKFANCIVPNIPTDISTYVEPFGGMFGIFFALDFAKYKDVKFIYNDVNYLNYNLFNQLKDSKEGNVTFVKLNFIENLLSQIIESLFNLKIQSLIIEGGAKLLTSFINAKLFDEILVFENPGLKFEKGIKSPKIKLKQEFELVGTDRLYKLP